MGQIFRLLPEGRVPRSIYWAGMVVLLCLSALLGWVDVKLAEITITETLWNASQTVLRGLRLILLYFFVVLTMRRLHDIGRSGLWFLPVILIPVLVPILGCLTSAEGANRYGPNPLRKDAS